MDIISTCATLAAMLAAAQGGETIKLATGSRCGTVFVDRRFPRTVTIDAAGSIVRGLRVRDGGNLRWKSGQIEAAGGRNGDGADGYGVHLLRAADVSIEGVLVTKARMGVVVDGGQRITVADSRLWRVRSDGVHAHNVDGLTVTRSSFTESMPIPSRCVVGTVVIEGISRAACPGVWTDGDHPDAVQVRNGVQNLTLTLNTVRGRTQGLAQMDSPGDAALVNVVVENNDVETDAYHRITFGNCINCRIRFNWVARAPGSTKKARIIAGRGVLVCGNTVQDGRSEPCTK